MDKDYRIVVLGEDRKLHKANQWDNKCEGGVKIIDKKSDSYYLISKYFWAYCDCDRY